MKAHYRTANGRITIEVEGGTQKELFKAVADVQEVFDADARCGDCQSADIAFRVREVDDNQYYELHCRNCQARLSFGQHKQGGTLFAKRVDDQKNPLPKGGWRKYTGRTS